MTARTRFSIVSEKLRQRSILISDGAWGTLLQAEGLKPGACPEAWNLDHPERVAAVARAYREAGADLVESNSFGGSPSKLAHYGLAERAAELNRAAAVLSREAAGEEGLVIASIGPSGVLLMMEEVSEEELYDGFRIQAEALAAGGAEALCIETMSDPAEAGLALRAAREHTNCELICTFTFERTAQGEYRTLMGTRPAEAALAALEAGATIVGTNCGNGMERMVPIVAEMRGAVGEDVPILVHANAGLPKQVGERTIFPEAPEEMAALMPALVEAGARIIGGCCGTTPAHIRALADAAGRWRR
ncbi:MAG: methionine synthase [Puniceicoccaceae bacterium]|nr:MAG: methionine synthase [Puniceicoccaceae bacterium]